MIFKSTLFGSLLLSILAFSSCNKNLKDDLKDIQRKVDSLKKNNALLRAKALEWDNLTGSNEPITGKTIFEDNNGNNRTIEGNYPLKGDPGSCNAMQLLSNGKYEIRIARFQQREQLEGIELLFQYDPATKKSTILESGHYWSDYDPYRDLALYLTDYDDNRVTYDLVLQKFDINTGEISLTCTLKADARYTGSTATSDIVPNPGKPMTTTFSFTGKLEKI